MIRIKRIGEPLAEGALSEVGRLYPVVYVFFAWPGLDEAMSQVLAEPEAGEIAVVADFDPSGYFCKRFGLSTPQSMIAFAVNCPASGAEKPEEYATAIQDARRWRKRNKAAEERGWPNASWDRAR